MSSNIFFSVLVVAGLAAGQGPLRSAGPKLVEGAPADSLPGHLTAKVSDSLKAKATSGEPLQLMLALSSQIDHNRVAQIKSLYTPRIRSFDSDTRAVRPSDAFAAEHRRQAAAERDKLIVAQRQEIARQARELYADQQAAVASRIAGLGGKVLNSFTIANILHVEVPAAALPALEADLDISAIFEAGVKQLNLATNIQVLGAPTYWSAGYRGGTQTVAVIDTGIDAQQPGFAGVDIETYLSVDNGLRSNCAAETNPTPADVNGHGTFVAGIVASQGTSLAPDIVGVAPGVGRLISVKVGLLGTGTKGCGDLVIATADVLAAVEFAATQRAPTVINLSLGATTLRDDQLENWVLDKASDDLDVTFSVSAGNDGLSLSPFQLGDLALSYNVISVANLDIHHTLDRSDDTIDPSSSRGPTPLGRRKPDIAAPGMNITSLLPGNQIGTMSGTSMSAPHIAGAAALALDAGAKGPKEVKANLLNSSQTPGWSRTAGWGSADIGAGYAQLSFVESSTVTAKASRYYRVAVNGPTRSTLVWNRHIDAITPDGGNFFGDFRDLNLESFDEGSNRAIDSSTSKIDNVEQIALTGQGSAIVKVSQNSPDNTAESFALAFATGNYQEIAPGNLVAQCSSVNEITATMPFQVSCTAQNTGGLALFGVTFRLVAPTGFTVSTVPSVVRIDPGAQVPFQFSVTSPITAVGLNLYSVNLAATAFGDQFVASAPMSINIRVPKPQDCTMVLTPASGTLSLTPTAQNFVLQLSFPNFDPLQPGVCTWSTFTASSWYGISGKNNGVGNGNVTIQVLAAPSSGIYNTRSGSVAITLNSVRSLFNFVQKYGK